jgi:hypothetical protein
MCDTPQARHSNVTTSGSPSNRVVRRVSRIGCAQLGQRGGMSAEFCAFVSHIVMVPGWRPPATRRVALEFLARQFGKSGLASGNNWEQQINETWRAD